MLPISNALRGFFARPDTRQRPQREPRRLRLECLEERTLLSGWAMGIGGPNGGGRGIAVDSNANVLITGSFDGTVDFDPSPAALNLTSVGGSDIFIAKYSADGALIWARRAGGNAAGQVCVEGDHGEGLVTDASGNAYVTGQFSGTADFGSYNLTAPAGSTGTFVAKLDASGNFLWARSQGSSCGFAYAGVAVDTGGSVYTTGTFGGSADFDPGPGVANLTSVGDLDVFASKLDSAGNFLWAVRAGGGSVQGAPYDDDSGRGIAVDAAGNVYIGGRFAQSADFGSITLTSQGPNDTFLAKLDTAGNFIWARRMGGTEDPAGSMNGTVATDGTGNVFISGSFGGIGDFGTMILTSYGSRDNFVAKVDSSGSFLWAKQLGSIGDELGLGIAVDATGNVYATGGFGAGVGGGGLTADFDPGTGSANLASEYWYDVFVWKLDPTGNFVSARRMGAAFDSSDPNSGAYDFGNAIAVDGSGNIYTTGDYSGTADFDTGTTAVYLPGTGTGPGFVSKTTQGVPTSPQLARLQDSPDPILNSGGTLTLTANDMRVVAGGSNVASVSFYRDKNGNGLLDLGTDTLLGTDTDGSNGWSLSVTVSIPKNVQQQTFTYFARAKDSVNVVGNVVSTTNTIKKSKVAAMISSRDRADRDESALPSHLSRRSLAELLRTRSRR